MSVAVAKAVGPDGKVYAVEISRKQIARVRKLGISNVVPVLSVPHDVSLARRSLDVAFLHDVASHVRKKDRPRFYASIAKALKRKGRLMIFKAHGGVRKFLKEMEQYRFKAENRKSLESLTDKELNAVGNNGIWFSYARKEY